MKTKRTLFSMAIVLLAFWFSDIVTVKFFLPKGADHELVQETSDVKAEDDNSIYSLSFEEADIASIKNRIYLSQNLYDDTNTPIAGENTISGFSATMSAFAESDTTENNDNLQNDNTNFQDESSLASIEEDSLNGNEEIAKEEDILSNNEDITTEEELEEEEVEESLYSNIGISNAKSYVNIRAKAHTEAEVLGKLHNGSAATILDTVDDWFYVESGSIKGYVKQEYLTTGLSDDELMTKYGILRASVKVDGLNVREMADQSSKKLDVIYKNESYPVLESGEEWIKLDIADDNIVGYVKREFITLIVKFNTAISKEEEKEVERLKAEEKAKKETAVKYNDGVSYSDADLRLLTALVHSEAGNQSYEGKLAVANIVLNRVKSTKYPNTMKEVIYQPNQFTVARSGALQKQMDRFDSYSSNSQLLSKKAAKAALEGANNIGSRMYFHSYKSAVKKGYDSKSNAVKIQDHLFW